MTEIITTCINKEDLDFCRAHQIKIAHLLRWAVEQRREDLEGNITTNKLKQNIDSLQGRLKSYREFIESKDLIEEFLGMK